VPNIYTNQGDRMNPVNFNMRQFRCLQDLLNSCLAGLLLTVNFAFAQNAEPAVSAPAAAAAAITPEGLAARYPSGSIQSIDMANRALAEVEQQRTMLERGYAVQQHSCYSQFLASACLDAAKESRQLALTRIRKVEVEANSFIRSARVVERDRNLAEKRASEANTRAKSPAGQTAAEPPAVQTAQHAGAEKTDGAQRVAEHDAKLRQQQQAEKDNAPMRAQAVAAFEKKAKDAAARQRDIAAKKADKERQAATKAAAASTPAAASVKP
jgi:colicin import membrane protein